VCVHPATNPHPFPQLFERTIKQFNILYGKQAYISNFRSQPMFAENLDEFDDALYGRRRLLSSPGARAVRGKMAGRGAASPFEFEPASPPLPHPSTHTSSHTQTEGVVPLPPVSRALPQFPHHQLCGVCARAGTW
jgi:hypothetical protein